MNPRGESSKNYRPPHSVEELLRRYKDGERHFVTIEFDDGDYDLRDAFLEGADFSRSYLTVDFRGANLRGANFSQANVKGCNFSNADLRGADFTGAALEATEFKEANLEGTNFAGASCYSYTFKEGETPSW